MFSIDYKLLHSTRHDPNVQNVNSFLRRSYLRNSRSKSNLVLDIQQLRKMLRYDTHDDIFNSNFFLVIH